MYAVCLIVSNDFFICACVFQMNIEPCVCVSNDFSNRFQCVCFNVCMGVSICVCASDNLDDEQSELCRKTSHMERASDPERKREWARGREEDTMRKNATRVKRQRARERDGESEREKDSERHSDCELVRCCVLFHKTNRTKKFLQVTHAVQCAL